MTNLQEAHRAFPSCYSSAFHTHMQLRCTLGKRPRKEGVRMWGCSPSSEAAARKAVCFFENSSYPLSPVPHRRNAIGNVCQRTREDAIYSTLLLVQNEGGKRRERKAGCSQFKGIGTHPKVSWKESQRGRGGSWRRKNEKERTEKDTD